MKLKQFTFLVTLLRCVVLTFDHCIDVAIMKLSVQSAALFTVLRLTV